MPAPLLASVIVSEVLCRDGVAAGRKGEIDAIGTNTTNREGGDIVRDAGSAATGSPERERVTVGGSNAA